jgi:hypothetical protein
MRNRPIRVPNYDCNKLSLICAILLCVRDFIFILIAYQKFCEDAVKKEKA